MKILFDLNVVLDLLLEREPFVIHAGALTGEVEKGRLHGFLCATSVTTLAYLLSRALPRNEAQVALEQMLALFEIAPVDSRVLHQAMKSGFSDFEDAVQYFSAVHAGVDGLVTRNGRDFQGAELPVYTPEELWSILQLN